MGVDETVREAEPADIDGIQRVARESWHETYPDILGVDVIDQLLEEWYPDEAIEACIDSDTQVFFVAVADEEIVGFANAGPHPPLHTFQLYRVYVHPDYWHGGIGKHLLARVEEWLVEEGVGSYQAEVFADTACPLSANT